MIHLRILISRRLWNLSEWVILLYRFVLRCYTFFLFRLNFRFHFLWRLAYDRSWNRWFCNLLLFDFWLHYWILSFRFFVFFLLCNWLLWNTLLTSFRHFRWAQFIKGKRFQFSLWPLRWLFWQPRYTCFLLSFVKLFWFRWNSIQNLRWPFYDSFAAFLSHLLKMLNWNCILICLISWN